MKIIRLTAKDFKRLVAVEIKPDGNTVLITGKNGGGKSSVLDSIVAALCGKKYHPEKPIRDGEKSAEISIETENWIIKRTFTEAGGGSITISDAKGMKASSPQKLLDKIVGDIAFDPMIFINDYDARKQRTVLMKLAGLDFSDIDSDIDRIKQQRSDVRAAKESYEYDAKSIMVPEGTPDEEISLVDLSDKLKEANELNATQERIKEDARQKELISSQKQDEADKFANTMGNLEQQIEDLEYAHAQDQKVYDKLSDESNDAGVESEELIKSIKPKIDTTDIVTDIANVEATNTDVRQKKQKAELAAKVEAKTDEYAKFGKKMKELEASKATRLSEAKMPLEGLSVTDDGVIFDGIPISQQNDAKKLEIGMGIAMAQNPELRVIRMNGNDLDDDSLKIISKLAADKDYQVWIERWSGGEGGIIIEDGSVKVEPEEGLFPETE